METRWFVSPDGKMYTHVVVANKEKLFPPQGWTEERGSDAHTVSQGRTYVEAKKVGFTIVKKAEEGKR